MFLKLLPCSRIILKELLFSNIWPGKILISSVYHTLNFSHLLLSFLLRLGCFKRPYLDLGFPPHIFVKQNLKTKLPECLHSSKQVHTPLQNQKEEII